MNDVLAILAVIGLMAVAIGAILDMGKNADKWIKYVGSATSIIGDQMNEINTLRLILRANPATRHHLQKRKKGRFTK